MTRYLIIKLCKQGYRFVAIDLDARNSGKNKKTLCVFGNLPELYPKMTVLLDQRNGAVTDYTVEMDEKNVKILEKNGVDVQKYEKALEIHKVLKGKGYDWNIYKTGAAALYNHYSFNKADYLHSVIYNDAADKVRLNVICSSIMKRIRLMHLSDYSIDDYLNGFNEIEREGVYAPLPVSIKLCCLSKDCFGFEDGRIYDKELRDKQQFITEDINFRLSCTYRILESYQLKAYLERLKKKDGIMFDDEQLDVLGCLEDSSPCIITGKAGTGKTSVIKLVLECFSNYNDGKILLIAPTGKASRRLAKKTGMPAYTIHRALRKKPDDSFVFYNHDNPLPHKLVIIDESSMIDTLLMYDLLNAVSPSSKIIFAGDHNQLPPVECGEPFFDFLKVLPQSTGYKDILTTLDSLSNGCSADTTAYQIITPYNKLNKIINDHMKKGAFEFNTGDKVIMTRNTKSYCNGDIGYIRSISMTDDTPGITGFRSGFVMDVDIEGETVSVGTEQYDDIALAYAITVHKMQGSECEQILMVVPDNTQCISNTKLLYTAVTRARKELDVVLVS